MPEVTLCVSLLTKRIFETRYGPGIAKIERRDIMYTYLQGDPMNLGTHRYRSLQKLLPEKVTVNVSANLAARLLAKKRQVYVGYFLHKIFQDEVLIYVHAQVGAGKPAQTAMKDWLEQNNIEEDDYGLESAYTSWKRKNRLLEKLRQKSVVNTHKIDPGSVKKSDTFSGVPYDYRDVIVTCNNVYNVGFCNLLNRNIKNRKGFVYVPQDCRTRDITHPRKILCYLLSQYCWMSSYEVAKFVKLTPRTIQRLVSKVSIEVVTQPAAQEEIDSIIAQTPYLCRTNRPQPQPVL